MKTSILKCPSLFLFYTLQKESRSKYMYLFFTSQMDYFLATLNGADFCILARVCRCRVLSSDLEWNNHFVKECSAQVKCRAYLYLRIY